MSKSGVPLAQSHGVWKGGLRSRGLWAVAGHSPILPIQPVLSWALAPTTHGVEAGRASWRELRPGRSGAGGRRHQASPEAGR